MLCAVHTPQFMARICSPFGDCACPPPPSTPPPPTPPAPADDLRLLDGFAACLQDSLLNAAAAWALPEGEELAPGAGCVTPGRVGGCLRWRALVVKQRA